MNLTLSADMRLCTPNYVDDHIWEMELGTGEPSALSLHTTFGLRARTNRIFPRFTEKGITVTEPADFSGQPVIQSIYPNYLKLTFSPLDGLAVTYEVRVPDSNSIAGRVTITNQSKEHRKTSFEMVAALIPLEGHPFSHTQMQMVNVLIGQTSGLVPLLFLTGGPLQGPGPQPSLMIDLDLPPDEFRQLTWVQVATSEHLTSFDRARLIAAQPWDAEVARLEMINTRDNIHIHTSDPEWDAALVFSQNTANRLFFPTTDNLPYPSFVQSRGPDHGYSHQGDGSDYPASWSGQFPLDALYLTSVLPTSLELGQGLLLNFLSVQNEDGSIDGRPGLGGQRGRYQAMPILAHMAWELYQGTKDETFLAKVYPKLIKFFWNWFSENNDRNKDGFPDWATLLQTGYEENPTFDTWNPWSQGADISSMHNPALLSLLYQEAGVLVKMAQELDKEYEVRLVKKQAQTLKAAMDDAWNSRTSIYRYLDRETGNSPSGKVLGQLRGPGTIKLKETFEPPIRLLIEVQTQDSGAKHPQVIISEYTTKVESEIIESGQFHWRSGGLTVTSQKVHEKLDCIQVKGIDKKDKVIVRRLDCMIEDHTLLLPLWAGIPNEQQAQALVEHTIMEAERFNRPFGIPACTTISDPEADLVCMSVYLPWNSLICEGLLKYGFDTEAARLLAHMMAGIIQNLKQKRAFYQHYHAETGNGIGERNALNGLAPVGLFLKVLGVQIFSPTHLRLERKNPFPWPVTIYYKGLKVLRGIEKTEVRFPNGKLVSIEDPTPCNLSF